MSYIGNIKKTTKLKYHVSYLAVLVFLAAAILLNSFGVLDRSATSLLSRIGINAILAVSLNLVVGFLGELSLGHAGFMCVGAYIGGMFANAMTKTVGDPVVALVLGMLVGGLVAAVFGFVIGLPALRLKGDYLAIVTLAFGEIVRNLFKNLPWFGGAMGLKTKPISTSKLFIIAFATLAVVVILIGNLIRSKHGRAITAVRDNEIAAKAMGINVTFYKLLVFVVAAFFAGVAGTLFSRFTTPVQYGDYSYNKSIEILVMVVFGGMGSINGSLVAAALITTLDVKLTEWLSGDLAAVKLLVYALILIFVILFNNAPAFKPLKDSLTGVIKKITGVFARKPHAPEKIKEDKAEWDRIETKIKMDELLSVEVVQVNKEFTPDKPEKEEK